MLQLFQITESFFVSLFSGVLIRYLLQVSCQVAFVVRYLLYYSPNDHDDINAHVYHLPHGCYRLLHRMEERCRYLNPHLFCIMTAPTYVVLAFKINAVYNYFIVCETEILRTL